MLQVSQAEYVSLKSGEILHVQEGAAAGPPTRIKMQPPCWGFFRMQQASQLSWMAETMPWQYAGVIPASFSDQMAAQRLAMCNDIGEASYVDSFIAAALLEVLRELPAFAAINERLKQRFSTFLQADLSGECPTLCTSEVAAMSGNSD